MASPPAIELKRWRGRSAGIFALVVTLAASAAINFALSRRVRALSDDLSAVLSARVGDRLPDIPGVDAEGRATVLRFDSVSTPTVLLVLRPGCGWCARNMANWRALVEQGAGRYRFAVVSLRREGLAPYLRENGLARLPVVADLSDPLARQAEFLATPTTLVVRGDGTIIAAWRGAYTGPLGRQVAQYFKVILPGVT